MRRVLAPLACLALFLAVSAVSTGCGYRLLGSGKSASGSAVTIGALDDRSRQPLFGAVLRTELASQAVERGELRVAPEGDPDALRLEVTVNGIEETGRAYGENGLPREYLLTGRADVVLRRVDGEAAWKVRNVTARREFRAGEDLNATAANKDHALRLLARDLADEVLRRVAVAASAEAGAGAAETPEDPAGKVLENGLPGGEPR